MKAYDYDCPIEATFEVVGGKWKASCVYYLKDGEKRFTELLEVLETISSRVLSKQLKELEEAEVVARRVLPEFPPKVIYSLTPYGQTLLPLIDKICQSGEIHMERNGKTSIFN